MQSLIDKIDDWLPQDQCAQCGYPQCRAYAAAIVAGTADINRCPPGGGVTLAALARLTRQPVRPLDPACGTVRPRAVAVIDETRCIGCTLCIKACPVDAIVGAAHHLHTVLAVECTGCQLCIAPCPVDCIDLRPRPAAPPAPDWRWPTHSPQQVARARARVAGRAKRLAAQTLRPPQSASRTAEQRRIHAEIRDAVARVRRKRARARDQHADSS